VAKILDALEEAGILTLRVDDPKSKCSLQSADTKANLDKADVSDLIDELTAIKNVMV